jgi:hypothetical protein
MITDQQRLEFMQKLAADVRGKNGIVLPEWESHFLASFLQSSRPAFWFTDGRRKATDRMWARYGPELNHPHPLDMVTERPKMAPADADGCEYLIRDEGRQRHCNDPATCQEPGKLRYCTMHGEAVVRDLKRAGKRIALIKFP